MTISLRFAARSDVGLVRQSNQDSGYAGPHLCLLCDGMGGPAGGDIASAVAVEHLMPLDADSHQAGELLGLMRDAVQAAHTELVTLSSQDPDLAGLGTTCIGVMRSGNKLAMVHVGDSRAYMLRDGTLTQVTTDHTFVEYLVETGRLTRDQARQHPQRSVLLRVLGDTEGEVQLDESIREAVPGDRWLLCSDGLSGVVDEAHILKAMRLGLPPGRTADNLPTGGEEAWSHAEASDLQGTLDGTRKLAILVAPLLTKPAPALKKGIEDGYAQFGKALDPYRDGNVFKAGALDDAGRKAVAAPVNQLADTLGQVNAALGLE